MATSVDFVKYTWDRRQRQAASPSMSVSSMSVSEAYLCCNWTHWYTAEKCNTTKQYAASAFTTADPCS
eukprot:860148-Rhodomonas_salina.2